MSEIFNILSIDGGNLIPVPLIDVIRNCKSYHVLFLLSPFQTIKLPKGGITCWRSNSAHTFNIFYAPRTNIKAEYNRYIA